MKFTALLLLFSLIMLNNCTTAFIDEGTIDPTLEDVTYDVDIQTIMFNHCTTCHGGATPFANLSLETYESVKEATENRNLLARIESTVSPMPPSGLMTTEDRAKITKWVMDGFN